MQQPSQSESRPAILYQVVLEPQRSASSRNINTAIIVFALASLPLSAMFTMVGAWPVAVFIGLDVLLLAAALRLHFWHGRSHEVVTITQDLLTVDRIGALGRRTRAWEAQPHWLKVEVKRIDEDRNRLMLRSRDRRVEIGRFLTAEEKSLLALELRDKLGQLSVWKGAPA